MALRTMKSVCDHLMNKDYKHIHRAYIIVCGQYSDDKNKTYLLDIDKDDYGNYEYSLSDIIEFIDTQCEPLDKKCKLVATIPTKNGIHLIVEPFNLQKFGSIYPDIAVHKNNPTILYVP